MTNQPVDFEAIERQLNYVFLIFVGNDSDEQRLNALNTFANNPQLMAILKAKEAANQQNPPMESDAEDLPEDLNENNSGPGQPNGEPVRAELNVRFRRPIGRPICRLGVPRGSLGNGPVNRCEHRQEPTIGINRGSASRSRPYRIYPISSNPQPRVIRAHRIREDPRTIPPDST